MAAIVIFSFYSQISFFVYPSDIDKKYVDKTLRLGGYVKPESLKEINGKYTFFVNDETSSIRVMFSGKLPPLFKDGQGIVLEGTYKADGNFYASKAFAKHDETYMPRSIVEGLKEKGQWNRRY